MSKQSERIIKNSVISTGGYTAGAALNFLIIILVARYLGREDFGYYSFILSFVAIFQLFSDLGTRNLLIRDVAVDHSNLSYRFGLSKTIAWALSGVAFLCIVAFINLANVPEKVVSSTYIAGIATLVTFHSVLYGAICRAFEKTAIDVAGFVLHKMVFLSIIVSAFKYNIGFSGIFFIMLISNTFQLIYYSGVVRYKYGKPKLVPDVSAAWGLFKESVPLGIAEVVRKIMWQVGTVLLTLLSTATATGIFSASYKIVQALQLFSVALAIPFFPAISRLGNNPDKLTTALERTFKFMSIFTLPLATVIFIFADPIIRLFYGGKFDEATTVLYILSITILFIFPNALFPFVFTSLNRQRVYSICPLISLCTAIVLNLVLIPLYGYNGAAVSTLIGEIILFCTGMYLLKKEKLDVRIARYIWKPLVASMGVGGYLFYFRNSPPLNLSIYLISGGLFYIFMLYILRILTQDEVKLLINGLKIKMLSPTVK